ncbi:hypothetical protein D3C73_1626980 [compost metagenome]
MSEYLRNCVPAAGIEVNDVDQLGTFLLRRLDNPGQERMEGCVKARRPDLGAEAVAEDRDDWNVQLRFDIL